MILFGALIIGAVAIGVIIGVTVAFVKLMIG